MSRPLLFCNIGWMKSYLGQTLDDKIIGGGRYVRIQKRGEEVCNFVVSNGKVFGYVRPVGGRIVVHKLGAPNDAVCVDGIDVVVTALRPGGKTVIVGWFKNATVYEREQVLSNPTALHNSNGIKHYRYEAKAEDVKLLLPDERTFIVPRGKNGMGNSNVWYGSQADPQWLNEVHRLIEDGGVRSRSARRSRPDHFKNAIVENAAMTKVWTHYETQGYDMEDVSKRNLGWDLEATSGTLKLRIEVKGLSGDTACIELTPKEYGEFRKALLEKSPAYRLCIVTRALTEPVLSVCSVNLVSGEWDIEPTERHTTITTRERTGATISLA